MRLTSIGFVLLFSLFACANVVLSADVAKIGVVDFQKILSQSNAGKSAQAEIEKQGKKMEKDLKKRGEEIENLKKTLEREAMVLNDDMRSEKERETRIRINDIKVLQQKYKASILKIENALVGKIKKGISTIIKDIGQKEGFLIIIEKRAAGVLYSPESIDITDQVIKIYNKSFKGSLADPQP